ncbi:MAG: hypothetical protein EG825_15995 [Rhodocyclaceae bacterium]|nr:hypothetical protein [Rhodocyclaceae bacterium]
MALHQVNLGYSAPEDRLLLRISLTDNKEFRFWLTRLMTRNLLGHLQTGERKALGVGDTLAAPVVQEFRREQATAENDFSSEFQSEAAEFPFGAEPRLVLDVELRAVGEHHELKLGLNNGNAFVMEMDLGMIQHFVKLIQLAAGTTDWGLETPAVSFGLDGPTQGMALH